MEENSAFKQLHDSSARCVLLEQSMWLYDGSVADDTGAQHELGKTQPLSYMIAVHTQS